MDSNDAPRPRGPWPFILAAMLTFMVAVSISFYCIAAAYPDPVLEPTSKPGVQP